MSNKRRKFIQNSSSAALALILFPHLYSCKSGTAGETTIQEAVKGAAKILFDVPPGSDYKLQNLSGNVWSFSQRGGTIGLYIDEKASCVIDTQFPKQVQNLINQIKTKRSGNIDLLINTHHHGDHTAGNVAFKGIVDKHVAHKNAVSNQARSAEARKIGDKQLYASTLITDEWSASVGNETINIKYYGAGHTDGDVVSTFVNSNVVHMGDLVFNRRFPYIDKANGANIENWVNILDQVIASNNTETKYIFGHSDGGYGITGTEEDLKAFQNYLEKLLVYGNKCKKEGISLEQAKESIKVIPGAEQWRGHGIDRSIDAVYKELSI